MAEAILETVGTLAIPVLSRYTADELLQAKNEGRSSVNCSLDLGLSRTRVQVELRGALLPADQLVTWDDVAEISASELACFAVTKNGVEPIRAYSDLTQRTVQLMPTAGGPPALLISGFVMHRVRDVNPLEGAIRMVRALTPLRGALLDTATGLGYAAIEAAKYADEVTTIELDPAAQWVASRNPWSRPLFHEPKIRQLVGDSSTLIRSLDQASYSCILHDPPAINLAGELYAGSLYVEMHRVLKPGGRLFHYVGDPKSDSGSRVTRGVIQRLRAAGFSKVVPRAEAFGVLASR